MSKQKSLSKLSLQIFFFLKITIRTTEKLIHDSAESIFKDFSNDSNFASNIKIIVHSWFD